MIRIYNKGIKRNLAGYARGLFSKSSEEVTSSLLAAVSKEIVYSISKIPNCCILIIKYLIKYRKQIKKTIGIPFVITNYRKGVFFAIFRDRSGAVRQVQQPSRSQKIIKKCALFGAKHFCGWETDRNAARLGKANARSCTGRTTSGVKRRINRFITAKITSDNEWNPY